MSYKLLRPCAQPACPELVHFPDRYCPEHAHLETGPQDNRPSARQRGYTTTWEKIRLQVLVHEPLCRRCAADGHAVIADLVHHKDCNPRNNSRDNLEPLCTPCHEKEHAGDQKGVEGGKISARIPGGTGGGGLRARDVKTQLRGWPMAGGRPRKPRQAKIIQGTFRKDRNPGREPAPPIVPRIPKPLAGMNRWARRLWKEMAPELVEQDLLTTLDLVTLEMCCDAYGMYREAKDAIFHPRDAKTGKRLRRTLSQYLVGRNSQTMPEMTTMKTGWQLYKAYMVEFGLSPASRNRIHLPGPKEAGQDPMEKILNEV